MREFWSFIFLPALQKFPENRKTAQIIRDSMFEYDQLGVREWAINSFLTSTVTGSSSVMISSGRSGTTVKSMVLETAQGCENTSV
jgi:hypothetical protein